MAKVLTIIKKNLISIICLVIAITSVAMIAYFNNWYNDLRDRVSARQGIYDRLKNLGTKARTLPTVDPEGTEASPLTRFPTDTIIKRGDGVTAAVALESTDMLKHAVDLNKHDVLLPGILPSNPSQTLGVQFQQRYAIEVDYADPDQRAKSLPGRILRCGTPPTEAEIAKAKDDIKNQILNAQVTVNGQAIDQQAIQQQIDEAQAKIPAKLRDDAARRFKIYVDDNSIKFATDISGATTPEATAIFNAQVGLWIVQDVLQGIADANANSDMVTRSPVKHLLRLTYPDDPIAKVLPGTGGPPSPGGPPGMGGPPPGFGGPPPGMQPGAAGPAGIPSVAPGGRLTPSPAAGPLGRYSSFLYDVVPFDLRMDVDEKQLPVVLATLSKGRFLGIANVNITALDAGPLAASGYVYGTDPVVRVDIQGEEYFMREWLVPLMPDRILQALGIQRTPPPGTPGTPQPGA